ncbi:MAG: 3D domain-containing protein [Longicatena sp.]
MKAKRILFVLFTCVFALYGCVSTEAKVFDTNIANNDFIVSNDTDYTPQPLARLVDNRNEVFALKAYAKNNQDTQLYTSVRDSKGLIVTKEDFNRISKQLLGDAREKKKAEDAEAARKAELERLEKKALSAFSPRITTYGVDCYGCQVVNGRGGTAMGVALDLNLGVQLPDGTWQPGIKYGNYYIIAADRSVPMCSIVKIENHGLGGAGLNPNEPFYAMVLDRGGGISGHHLDLYTGSESNSQVYRVSAGNPTAQIIRMGGQTSSGCAL